MSRAILVPVLAAAVAVGVIGGITAVRQPSAGRQASYQQIDAPRLAALLDRTGGQKDFQLVNVHVPYAGEIPRTDAFVLYTDVAAQAPRLWPDRRTKLVVYCQTGRMSVIAAEALVRLGYRNVVNLEGGMVAWQAAGYPLLRRQN